MGCQKYEEPFYYLPGTETHGTVSYSSIVKQRRLPFGRAVKVSVDEDIHCICRMPYDKTLDMIQCSFCSVWFHGTSVHIDNIADYLSEKWTCCKCIETND